MGPLKRFGLILVLAALACWFARLAAGLAVPLAALVYLPMSVATAAAYGLDKARAQGGKDRIPERRLHLLELAGGWPGALWAREHFRHKTRDRVFRVWFWIIGLVHLVGWGAWLWLS